MPITLYKALAIDDKRAIPAYLLRNNNGVMTKAEALMPEWRTSVICCDGRAISLNASVRRTIVDNCLFEIM